MSSSSSSTTQKPQPLEPSGALLRVDPPLKQFLVHLNTLTEPPFILEELDKYTILVPLDVVDFVKEEVDKWMDSNVFVDGNAEE